MNLIRDERAESVTVAPQTYRDLLVEMLKNIAPFAHGMRRFSVTDREIDGFVAEVIAVAASGNVSAPERVHRYLVRGEQIFNRAKTLYQWACEVYGRPPKIGATAFSFVCPEEAVMARATEVQESRREKLSRLGTLSWNDLCVQKLGAFASIAISAVNVDLTDYDPYDFIHESLCTLSGEAGRFELAALSQRLEKETLKLVNLAAGDTSAELPAAKHSAVRASKIVIVDRVPAPREGVSEDRV